MESAEIVLVDSMAEAEEFIDWCRHPHPRLAIDTETTDIEGGRARMRLFQVGDSTNGWVIPFERGGWGGLVKQALQELRGTTFIMHNFSFDQTVLWHDGLELPDHRVEDSRIKAHIIDPTQKTGLKDLGDRLIGPYASQGRKKLDELMRKNKWTWSTVPYDLPEYWWYGGLDTVLTARVDAILHDQVFPKFQRIYDLEYACQVVLKQVQRRGVRCDMGYVSSKLETLRYDIDGLRARALDGYGIKNLTSDVQVAKAAVELGWDPPPETWTASGRPSMAKAVIAGYIDGDEEFAPLLKLCFDAKHLEKMASTQYLGGYANLVDAQGFIHPSINPLGARTGRMSVREPALQTLHRDAVVRDAFVPREGNKLIFADYDQMEVRFTAHYAADSAYAQAIRESKDVHRDTASQIYGVAPEDVTKKQRAITKNAVYAIIYGAGLPKFALTAGITHDEAREFLAKYHWAFPGVKVLQDGLQQKAIARLRDEGMAYVTTPAGRRHPLAKWETSDKVWEDPKSGKLHCDGEYYKLLNYLIQGTGADELKRAVVDADRAGIGEYLVLLVHDELGFDVPEGEVEEVKRTIKEVMENHTDYNVPLTVDVTVVDRWGDKYADTRKS